MNSYVIIIACSMLAGGVWGFAGRRPFTWRRRKPALIEADDAEVERLESWIDAFNKACDPADDNTYVDAIVHADNEIASQVLRSHQLLLHHSAWAAQEDTPLGRLKKRMAADYEWEMARKSGS